MFDMDLRSWEKSTWSRECIAWRFAWDNFLK
jgi:hypothetical protein